MSTSSSFHDCVNEQGPIISTLIFGFLFIVSEVFPYINSVEGNGIVDEILQVVRRKLMERKENKENQTTEQERVENLV